MIFLDGATTDEHCAGMPSPTPLASNNCGQAALDVFKMDLQRLLDDRKLT